MYAARDADAGAPVHRAIALTQEIFDRALEVQAKLARSGRHRVPIPDLIVAAAAEDSGMTILHYDRHHEPIAEVTKQLVEWVVPRGSAD